MDLSTIVRQSPRAASMAAGTLVKGAAFPARRIVESFRGTVAPGPNSAPHLTIATHNFSSNIDISWLQCASETFRVSADPRDYVLVEVPLVTVDIPNRNSQGFPYEEVTYYDPLLKRQVFRTFVGSAACQDHDNMDPLKAKGVNFDATMVEIPEYGVWKIVVLTGFDRTKDRWLAEQVLNKQRQGFSMGCLVSNFVCSYCGNIETQDKKCNCMATWGKGAVHNGHLVWQVCTGCNFIENSSVEDPADVTAWGGLLG